MVFDRLLGGYLLLTGVGRGHCCHGTRIHSITDLGDFRMAAFNCQKQDGNGLHRRQEDRSGNQASPPSGT